jgi:succinyl-CoA synthetase beta subunit
MVKSQIHAGGRGKGTFTDGFKGGVKFSATKEKALENAKAMLGNTLVTAQTGPDGRKVQTIYFTEAANLGKRPDGRDDEYYLAILLDRATSCPVIVASTEGGMEIEHVAHHTPEKIFKVQVDPAVGLQAFQARQIAFALGFSGDLFKQCVTLVTKLYQFYWEKDCAMVEVNPLLVTKEGKLLALDAKVSFDDNATPTWSPSATSTRRTPRRSKPRSTASPTSPSTATSPASSTAPASRCPRWTSSSTSAAARPTSSTSAAAPRRTRSRRPSRSSWATPT